MPGRKSVATGVLIALLAPGLATGPGNAEIAPPAVERGIGSPLADNSDRQSRPLPHGPVLWIETRSQRALSLGLDAIEQPAATRAPAAYALISNADHAYQVPMAAVRLGGDRQVVGFDATKRPLLESRLHLLFPEPLMPGVDYRLDACAAVPSGSDRTATIAPPACASVPVHYNPDRASSSIQVDQVGYAPGSRKIAFLGNWMGSAGPLPLDVSGFEVIDDETGEPAFAGQARLSTPADPWSGCLLYTSDAADEYQRV